MAVPVSTYAHSGGTDKYGCHENRKTGHYHCHHGKKRQSGC
ncbi:YHYH domain-containing protein [Candidatus Puniceispirillum marinum]|nr:YHYH domain-containing protein [Candidatus Puniceispirillum marinum]